MRDMIVVLGAQARSGRDAARQLRAANYYGRVLPAWADIETLAAEDASGIVLTEPLAEGERYETLLSLGLPTLLLGAAAEAALARFAPKDAARRSDIATVRFSRCALFEGIPDGERKICGAAEYEMPEGLAVIAEADGKPVALAYEEKKAYLLLSRIERNDPDGMQILLNFAKLCGCNPWWTLEGFIDDTVRRIRDAVGEGNAVCAVSGGLDSTVAALLTRQALGSRAHCVFVDTGLMREGEAARAAAFFREEMRMEFRCVEIADSLLYTLRGMETMDAKWQIAAREISQAIQSAAREIGACAIINGSDAADMLARGKDDGAKRPEGALPLLHPVGELFKDEVRRVGEKLGLGPETLNRQPFPSIGLAARISGEVTPAKLKMLRTADALFADELRAMNMEKRLSAAYAMLDTVGGKCAIVLRALQGHGDGAMAARLPSDLIERTASRICEEIPQVRRVLYDFTPGDEG